MSRAPLREVRAGLILLIAVGGLLGLLALAGGGPGFLTSRRHIDVVFRDGQGIRVGSPVRVAGIDAGRVVAVNLAEVDGALRARVQLAVPSDLASRLKQDAKITIQSSLTGQCCVNIVSSGRSEVALIAGQVVQGVESSMFDPILEQVGLGPVERSHLSHTIGEVRQTVDAVGPRMRLILTSLQETATNLKDTSAAVRPSVELAAGRMDELVKRLDIDKLEDTLNRINAVAVHADGLIAEARPELVATITNVRQLTGTLQEASARNRPKIETLIDGMAGTKTRLDQVLANSAMLTGQGAEFFAQNRANLERTTANVKDATDYGNKLVQKLYGNPFYLSPFYKPKPDDIRAQQSYDAANTFMNGAKELNDAVKTLQAMSGKPNLTPQERTAYNALYKEAYKLDSQLQQTAADLAAGLRATNRR